MNRDSLIQLLRLFDRYFNSPDERTSTADQIKDLMASLLFADLSENREVADDTFRSLLNLLESFPEVNLRVASIPGILEMIENERDENRKKLRSDKGVLKGEERVLRGALNAIERSIGKFKDIRERDNQTWKDYFELRLIVGGQAVTEGYIGRNFLQGVIDTSERLFSSLKNDIEKELRVIESRLEDLTEEVIGRSRWTAASRETIVSLIGTLSEHKETEPSTSNETVQSASLETIQSVSDKIAFLLLSAKITNKGDYLLLVDQIRKIYKRELEKRPEKYRQIIRFIPHWKES